MVYVQSQIIVLVMLDGQELLVIKVEFFMFSYSLNWIWIELAICLPLCVNGNCTQPNYCRWMLTMLFLFAWLIIIGFVVVFQGILVVLAIDVSIYHDCKWKLLLLLIYLISASCTPECVNGFCTSVNNCT